MIFDIKMEDFKRKARLVAGGHMTKVLATITYARIVYRETIRIALWLPPSMILRLSQEHLECLCSSTHDRKGMDHVGS